MTKTAFVGLALCLGLAACKTTEESMMEEGATKLAQWEINTLMSDSTREWASGKGSSYHAPDGAYLWKMDGGKTGEGMWMATAENQFCIDVEEWYGDTPECFDMYKMGDAHYSVDSKGKKRTLGAYQAGNTL